MTDYIKRENAISLVQHSDFDTEDDKNYIMLILGKEYGCPSADVAPVRHGRWEGCKGDITCSACGEYALYDSEDIEMQYRTLYCPFCGAKMDEGGADGINYR